MSTAYGLVEDLRDEVATLQEQFAVVQERLSALAFRIGLMEDKAIAATAAEDEAADAG